MLAIESFLEDYLIKEGVYEVIRESRRSSSFRPPDLRLTLAAIVFFWAALE